MLGGPGESEEKSGSWMGSRYSMLDVIKILYARMKCSKNKKNISFYSNLWSYNIVKHCIALLFLKDHKAQHILCCARKALARRTLAIRQTRKIEKYESINVRENAQVSIL